MVPVLVGRQQGRRGFRTQIELGQGRLNKVHISCIDQNVLHGLSILDDIGQVVVEKGQWDHFKASKSELMLRSECTVRVLGRVTLSYSSQLFVVEPATDPGQIDLIQTTKAHL